VNPGPVLHDLEYYHALYHLVSHWGAYMASMGLLLTIGVLLSTASIPGRARKGFCIAFIAVVPLGAWFFLWRMYVFANEVNHRLAAISDYVSRVDTHWLPHPYNLLTAAAVAFGLAVWCIVLAAKSK
jgi:hypothetical protein